MAWNGVKQLKTKELCRNTHSRCDQSSELATLAELSATIIHELKQPFASIMWNAEAARCWLAVDHPNLVEAMASIDRIVSEAYFADETIERVRALFKQKPLDKREASIPDIVSEAVGLILQDPNKRGVPIKWHFDESLPGVCVDSLAIRAVFINLISNAIEVLAYYRSSPLVRVQAAVNDKYEMVIQVVDNGPGIDETVEIFDAFVTTKQSGLGIGLALSRSIAEAHGGRLTAENNPGGGATFCLTLPLS